MLDVTIGETQVHDHLTLFPLLAPAGTELPYALLGDALAAGTLHVGEVGEGTVPALLAQNGGELDVLVLDGEQLIGSRQNRMTNRSILLPAGAKVRIPVSCMEQGRWHFVSDAMAPAPQHSPAKVRRRARESEVRHAYAGEVSCESTLREAQGEVWQSIADTASRLGVCCETGAMDAVFDAHARSLEAMERCFPLVEGQVGLLAFAGGAPIGLDVVGGRTLYARLHGRLLRGYLLDALDRAAVRGPAAPAVEASVAQRYLDAVREVGRVEAPTVGKGRYAVLAGAVIGGELTDGERVAHLSAFPAAEPGAGGEPHRPGSPLPRPSQRRRPTL